MTPDPSVIAAIEASLSLDPTNLALRRHLASLLAAAGRHAEALDHVVEILRHRPDDLAALTLGAESADATGDHDRGAAYRRVAAAIVGSSPHASVQRPIDFAGRIPDTADELVESWGESSAAPELGSLSRPILRLSDVGGMAEVKRRIEISFLAPLRNPELRAQFGKSLRGGLLLWGPPGCGKTYLARALAGELGASFYEVGLSDVLDMWIGSSERNLHSIFEVARAHSPCLLFFDEIDALGHKRSNLRGGGSAMRGVVNQLLVELDGASTDNADVFILAASNHPWDIDSALLRPGRFDRSLFVLPPDLAAREAILAIHLQDKPTQSLDITKIAKSTDGLSGADLALICDHATERALEASLRSGELHPINQDDLLDGARNVNSSIRPWLESARNYALFGNASGAYDELAAYLKRHRP
ncbi:MAG TPA: ATP-binding protein [Steroidobacteraceae bacterium]|jgi:SpoVK/Ycf46/Vps4 family AAA+-type ATPase|nr:ATP-binding protein [Steroidobacteraceae bacterium]